MKEALAMFGASRLGVVERIRFGGVDFDNPNFERHPYDKWNAYGQSKSANSLFAVA